MGQIADALRKLIDNPDDLSTLPQLIAQVEQTEDSVTGYQDNISKLQNINKQYLAQIPIPGETTEELPEEDTNVTIEDAKEQIIAQLGGH